MNDVAEKIRALRINNGLTQQYVAGKLGIKQPTYGKIERGETSITVDKLIILSKVFNVEISDFFAQGEDKYVTSLKKTIFGLYSFLKRLNTCVKNTTSQGYDNIKLSDIDAEWLKGSPAKANLNPFLERDYITYHRRFPDGFGLNREDIDMALTELLYNNQYLEDIIYEESD